MFELIEQRTPPINFDSPAVDPNLDDSFIEDVVDEEIADFDRNEDDLDNIFYRLKRLSCFAHNLMLAAKTVRIFVFDFYL